MRRPIVLLALVLAGILARPAPRTAHAVDDVRVPNVVGRPFGEAVERLAQSDLGVAISWVAGGTSGRVMGQEPPGGARVTRGTMVEIQVARPGGRDALLPSVVGRPEHEARALLEALFTVEVVEVPAAPGDDGRVLAQDPPGNVRRALGSLVRLEVGRAEPPGEVIVPALQRLRVAEAEDVLLGLGLVPVPTYAITRRQAPWTVVGQDPFPGTALPVFSPVQIQVELPPLPPARVRVPSLWGVEAARGAEILLALGLQAEVERVPSLLHAGRLFAQDPPAGAELRRGTTIRVRVARTPRPGEIVARIPLPSFEGQALPEAYATVRALGLVAALHTRVVPDRPLDVVAGQEPPAGETLPLGATVHLAIPQATEVPDFVGRRLLEAQRLAEEAGLVLALGGITPVRHATRVVTQEIPPGTLVAVGSTIRVATVTTGGSAFVRVPELRGRSLVEVYEMLATLGLQGQYEGPRAIGLLGARVTAQMPLPGSVVPRGARVRVTYVLDPAVSAVVEVPNLRGLGLAEAERRLAALGLRGRVSIVAGGGPPGVTGQIPLPGSRVPQGTVIQYTYRR